MSYTRLQAESNFRQRIKDDLKTIKRVFAEKIQQVGIVGTADWHLCVNGWYVAIESKRSKKEKPGGLQQHKLERVKKCGGYSFKATPENWHLILKKIKKLAGLPHPRPRL